MPESAEEFYARIAAATDATGRLRLRSGVEEWDTFPLESPSWRLRPIEPLQDSDPPRRAESAGDCWCSRGDDELDHGPARIVWRDDHWLLGASQESSLPVTLFLEPRHHEDLAEGVPGPCR